MLASKRVIHPTRLRHNTNKTVVERSHLDKAKIHHVIGIDGTTLIVFYTEAHCWQFRLISAGGTVFGKRKIYYTAEAALKAGLEWVGQGS